MIFCSFTFRCFDFEPTGRKNLIVNSEFKTALQDLNRTNAGLERSQIGVCASDLEWTLLTITRKQYNNIHVYKKRTTLVHGKYKKYTGEQPRIQHIIQ